MPDYEPIVVTGASGHTGVRLVKHLVEQGRKVRAITRDPALIPLALRRQMEICRADLTQKAEAREAVRKAGSVVAMTHIRLAPHVIEAMKAEGIRRGIFMSSTRRFTRFPEESARAVIEGEEAVMQSELDWTILRASMIYGGKRDNNLEHLVRWVLRLPIHPLPGGGKMLWQPVFTWDVVGAIEAALTRDVSIGKAYTIAGPEPVSYREMVETILRVAGKRALLIPVPITLLRISVSLLRVITNNPPIREDQIQRLFEDKVFDISDAVRDLDFHPLSFEEGMRRKLSGCA
ncbi:MAG: NAD(P)H-binding protein [Candidatus Sumerlaeaceae bacterium]|nr:NAD(P)H-binding protein [Candidatus Sumerlaeaceae bacterium]